MENINELATALAKAQGEMKAAKMDKTNYYGGRYATLASIQEATRPVLSKHGLSIVQLTQQADNGILIETIMLHSSGQSISSDWLMPPQQDVQKAGSYLSYVKRYEWASICGIAGDDDDDGESAAGVTQKQTKKQPKKQPPPPKAAAPTSPDELMTLANEKLETEYLSPVHMLNAIKKHTGAEDYTWPKPDDAEGWRFAYKQLKEYKESKDAPLFEGVEEIPFE